MDKLDKSLFEYIENAIGDLPRMKQEIARLRELKEQSEKGDLPLELKGYAAASGIPLNKKAFSEAEARFLERYLSNPNDMEERFGLPCRNHVINAEFCGAFYIHMTKCPQYEGNGCGDCPLFESGFPVESHAIMRRSEYWMNNHSDIEKEIARYLHAGEMPPARLLKFAYDSTREIDKAKVKKSSQQNDRPPIPVSLRFEVLHRDNFTCVYCGRTPREDEIKLHVDHVIPYSKGGKDELDNLVAACQDCNLGKSDKFSTGKMDEMDEKD